VLIRNIKKATEAKEAAAEIFKAGKF